jgi:hypothetical protein
MAAALTATSEGGVQTVVAAAVGCVQNEHTVLLVSSACTHIRLHCHFAQSTLPTGGVRVSHPHVTSSNGTSVGTGSCTADA